MVEPKVNLNTATAEELTQLPGIGPVLADRIMAYRDTVHPFEEPVEIAAVPGISERMYHAVADRLEVTPPAPLPPLVADTPPEEMPAEVASPTEETPAEAVSAPELVALPSEVASPTKETPAGAVSAPELLALPSEVTPSPAELSPAPEEAAYPAEPRPPSVQEKVPPVTSPPPSPTRRRGLGLSWLWSALVGGLLGMVFTLLVLAGINGSLDVGHSRAILEVENRLRGIGAEVSSLQGETAGLRQRLDVLEGLTARMEQVESSVNGLRDEAAVLEERAGALEDGMEAMSEELTEMRTRAERVEVFFQRLQALLGELFGEGGATTLAPTPIQSSPTPLPGE